LLTGVGALLILLLLGAFLVRRHRKKRDELLFDGNFDPARHSTGPGGVAGHSHPAGALAAEVDKEERNGGLEDDGMGGRLGTGVGGVISPFSYVPPEERNGSMRSRTPDMSQSGHGHMGGYPAPFAFPQPAYGQSPYNPSSSPPPGSDAGTMATNVTGQTGSGSSSAGYYTGMNPHDPHAQYLAAAGVAGSHMPNPYDQNSSRYSGSYGPGPQRAATPPAGVAMMGRRPPGSAGGHSPTNSSSWDGGSQSPSQSQSQSQSQSRSQGMSAVSAKEREAYGHRAGGGLGVANPDTNNTTAPGGAGAEGSNAVNREEYLRQGPVVHRDGGRVRQEEDTGDGGDEIPPTYDSIPRDDR
jgi:hypothetical protein